MVNKQQQLVLYLIYCEVQNKFDFLFDFLMNMYYMINGYILVKLVVKLIFCLQVWLNEKFFFEFLEVKIDLVDCMLE